jgi:hypothetical protein
MCFQWSREERTGVFGVPAAHNLVKNLVKFCSRSWPWRSRSHLGALVQTGPIGGVCHKNAATLLAPQGRRLIARDSFFIQVKIRTEPFFEFAGDGVDWLRQMRLPYFPVVAKT